MGLFFKNHMIPLSHFDKRLGDALLRSSLAPLLDSRIAARLEFWQSRQQAPPSSKVATNQFDRRYAAIRNVGNHVLHFFRRAPAHEKMKAERWGAAGRRRLGSQLREEGKGKIAPVPLSNDGKPCLLECLLVLLRFCHGTQVRRCCPRNGIGKVATSGSHHVIDSEARVGPQCARDLGGQFFLVFDVHADMQHVSAIEASFGKWHREGASLMKGYALIEANPLAQGVARFDVFSGQVYAGDPAPVSARDKACGTAEAASNVENMLLSREAELVQKFLGRSPPADMKLVDWSKIIYRYSVWRLAERDDASAYRLDKTAVRVVLRDIGLHWHLHLRKGGHLFWAAVHASFLGSPAAAGWTSAELGPTGP